MANSVVDEISGRKFGRFTVICKVKNANNTKHGYYKCVCSCGNERVVARTSLIQGTSKSCGCLRNEINREKMHSRKGIKTGANKARRLDRKRVMFNHLLNNVKHNQAIKRGLEFSLDLDTFIDLGLSNCFYCGKEPSNTYVLQYTKETMKYSGLDRRDNTKGYTKENTVACCYQCNRAKSDTTEDEFLMWIERVHNNQTKG